MLCVGLDPEPTKIPGVLSGSSDPILEFNRAIIDATKDLVCAFKPQIAFYAARGAEETLRRTIEYIREVAPKVCIILDSKRGDIGNTAEQYALEAFERYGADAVTVNPYLGFDSVEPFLRYADRGVFVLCRTSNPGSKEFQQLLVQKDGELVPLFEVVAEQVAGSWNCNQNAGLVVGATHPSDLKRVREIAPELPLLVPGIGAQGGSLEEVLQSGLAASGYGLVINASRGVLYASSGEDFQQAARAAAEEYVLEMRKYI